MMHHNLSPLSIFVPELVAYVCLGAVSRTKATVPTALTTHSAMLERAPRPPRRHLPIPTTTTTTTTGAMLARAIATLNPTMNATPTQVADLDAATMIMVVSLLLCLINAIRHKLDVFTHPVSSSIHSLLPICPARLPPKSANWRRLLHIRL